MRRRRARAQGAPSCWFSEVRAGAGAGGAVREAGAQAERAHAPASTLLALERTIQQRRSAPPGPRSPRAARARRCLSGLAEAWCAACAAAGLQQAVPSCRVLAARCDARRAVSLPGEEAHLAVSREASHSASGPFAALCARLFPPLLWPLLAVCSRVREQV